ncbi:Protein UBASH3A-like protein [Aphelenchoides bicaudatus]|nr:Protein UBASH3A-like protein [Aphelenchoides bicaudatus]
MRSIWIVRHGERVDNVNPSWRLNAPRGAWDDPILTDRGHQQAREVGLQLAKANEPIDYVFCSPFTRTIQTATGILNSLEETGSHLYKKIGVPPIFVEPGFCESLHVCQPTPGHLEMKELTQLFPRIDQNYKPYHTKHYTETTSMCCQRRISDTIEKLLKDYLGNVLIVSHGSPIAACHVALSGRSVYVGQCTISHYSMHEKPQSELDNLENEEVVQEAAQDFVVKSEKFHFKPTLLGDSSHLSDQTNLRGCE